jgi:hypothetical protein
MRVKYDKLPKGRHTWVFTEKEVELAVCPEHGVVALWGRKKACPQMVFEDGGAEVCGRSFRKETRLQITGQPNVYRGDVIEVEDLNDPKSERARIVRGHLEGLGEPGQQGYQPPIASIVKEEKKPTKSVGK